MLWICKQDRVRYAVDSPACPECGSTEYWEEGQEPPLDGGPDEAVVEADANDEPDTTPSDAPPLNESGTEPVATDKPVEVVEPRRRGAK